MSVSNGLLPAVRSDVSVVDAVSIVVATAPFGYLFGSLFTVHVVPSETMAVWLTTVVLSALSLLLWSVQS